MYLVKSDFRKQIQLDNLNQIIGDDNALLTAVMLVAQQECVENLVQKYDTDKEFTDTNTYSYTTAYKAGSRVILDASTYSAASTYALNDLVVYSGDVYRCTTAITVAEAWNAGKWSKIGAQYAIYYGKYPAEKFDYKKKYYKDDTVYYGDRVYTCLITTPDMPHSELIQYRTEANIPLPNIFPDNPTYGSQYWSPAGSAYSISAGVLPTDTTKWVAADNRDQRLVMVMIDLALFHIHSRLAPRNVPQLRIDRYLAAVEWLKAARDGAITVAMPVKQPQQGSRVRYGGNIKNINSY